MTESVAIEGTVPRPRLDEERELADVIARRLGRSLHVRHLDVGSCNGCDWEIAALLNPIHDVQRLGIDFVASPRHADLLLVTGVMTRNLEEAALRTYEAMPEPRVVVAVGACAISGGVFAGTYAARDGIGGVLPASPGGPHPRSAAGHGSDGTVRRVITGRRGSPVVRRRARRSSDDGDRTEARQWATIRASKEGQPAEVGTVRPGGVPTQSRRVPP